MRRFSAARSSTPAKFKRESLAADGVSRRRQLGDVIADGEQIYGNDINVAPAFLT
jgi:hypothetical protein